MKRIELCLGQCNWDDYSARHGPPEGYFCADSVAKVLTLALWRGEPRAAGSTRVARVVLCLDGQPSYTEFDRYRPIPHWEMPREVMARWSMAPLALNAQALPTAPEIDGCDVTFLMARVVELAGGRVVSHPGYLELVGMPDAELERQIMDAFTTVNAHAIELCDPARIAVCKGYASSNRLLVYSLLASDSTGRLAQLAEVAPGALVLIGRLGADMNARVLAGDSLAELSEFLIGKIGPDEQRMALGYSDDDVRAQWEQWLRMAPATADFDTLRFPMPLPDLCDHMPADERARLRWCKMMAQSVHSLQGAGRAGEHMLKSARDDALRWLAAHCIELDRSEPSIWADARPVLSVYALCHQGRRLNFSRLSKSFVHEVQELHQTHRKDVDVYAKECRPFVEGPILERTGRTTWVRQLNDPSALLEEAEAQKNSLSKRFFDAWGYHAFYAAMLAGQRVTFSLARSMESTLKIWYLCEASGFRDCALTDEARAALDELVEDCGVKIHERIVPGLGPYAPPEGSENEMGFGVEPDWVKEGQEYTAFNDPRRSVEDVSTSTW